MITSDYHTHTNFSSDSTATLESMIEKAISLGLERLCVTDHMDYDFPQKYNLPFVFDIDEYFHTLLQAKKKYADQINVLIGIECGLRPYLIDRYNKLLSDYAFDFVIGSSHLVGDMDPYQSEYWDGRSEEEGIRAYFQTIIDNVKAGADFDVYGHLDYVVRYGPTKNHKYSYEKFHDIIDEMLLSIIQARKGIEINTAGYKYGLGHAHPHQDLIKRYLELGGTIITIGSDGHKPEHLAYDFEVARKMLLSLGVKQYYVFENRIPIPVNL